MKLKISSNLRQAMEKNKKMELENSPGRLIINMSGKKNNKGFRPLTDLDLESNDVANEKSSKEDGLINIDGASLEEVKAYVMAHTSGVKYHYDLAEGGVILVSFREFVGMIQDGYNIIKAEVLNENYISIEYQKEIKREMKR